MNEKNQTNTQQPVLIYPQYTNSTEDEIKLFDIWQVLVKQKKTILIITVLVTILSVLYALWLTPIYRSEIVFLPPSNNDIQTLKIKGFEDNVDVDSVYSRFRQNLGSIANRKLLFETMDLLNKFVPEKDDTVNVNEVFNKFNSNISLKIENPKKGKFTLPVTSLSLEEKDPVLIAEIVNRIAKEAEEMTKVDLISDVVAKVNERKKEIQLEIRLLLDKTKKQRLDEIERLETSDALERRKIKDQIKTLRSTAKEKRMDEIERLETLNLLARRKIEDQIKTLKDLEKGKRFDRISKLTEASEIARAMGIKDPIDYKLKKINKSATTNSQIMTDISSNSTQLYTLGFEALEAEITSLSKRTNDVPFIEELRSLEEKLKLLEYNREVEQLKNRTSDDPYIKELRGLEKNLKLLENNRIVEQLKNRKDDSPFVAELREKEESLAYFESININQSNISVARLDQAAFPSEKKIKPNRRLIVIIGLIIGLILGILVAFLMSFHEKLEGIGT